MAYYEPGFNPSQMGDITFTYDEMMKWVEEIGKERHRTTANNNLKVATEFIWPFTNGVITNDTIDAIRNGIFDHYNGPKGGDSRKKALGVVKRFLNAFFDEDTARFVKRLEQNKPRLPRRMNKRILEDGDIRNIINSIQRDEERPEIRQQHCALLTFLTYTGMRPASAIRLKVGNIRDAIQKDKPCLLVDDSIDKTFTEHYVPLHPVVVKILGDVIDGRADIEPVFTSYTLLQRFLKDHPTPMINQPSLKVEVRDCRKYMIQKSKVALKLNPEILDYIVSHNTSSLDRKHYTGYKPEVFYDEYMASWRSVNLLDDHTTTDTEEKPPSESQRFEKEIAEKRKMLEAIKAEPEENIQADQDRYERFLEEERIKDAEIHSLIQESIRLEEEIENAKSEKGIH